MDGSTFETTQTGVDGEGNPVYEDPTYLDGAIFDLYRLDATYCGGTSATAEPTVDDYATYSFLYDADGKDYANSRTAWVDELLNKAVNNYYASDTTLDAAAKNTAITDAMSAINTATGDYSTLDNHANKYGAFTSYQDIFNEYVLPKVSGMTYQYVPVKVSNCANCGTEHYHVQAYAVFWNDITSTNTAEGVTVTGLDPNTYLLVETKAPTGYHELSTALQFEIKEYDSAKANESGSISYKGFIDDEGNDVNDGIYDIVVQNFTGLVLPSTGGMGTLLFTIIGIMIMAGAMVVIIVKSRKRQNAGIY